MLKSWSPPNPSNPSYANKLLPPWSPNKTLTALLDQADSGFRKEKMKVAKDSSPGMLSTRCCNTTEICGKAQALSLVSHQDLEMSSKLVWATPWEDWVSCMQSSSCPLPHVFLHIVFNACSLAIHPSAKPFSLFHCINGGGDPFSLGWAGLSAPRYLCSQLPILLSMTKST